MSHLSKLLVGVAVVVVSAGSISNEEGPAMRQHVISTASRTRDDGT